MGQNAAVAGDDPEQVELGSLALPLQTWLLPSQKLLFNIFNPIGVQQTMCIYDIKLGIGETKNSLVPPENGPLWGFGMSICDANTYTAACQRDDRFREKTLQVLVLNGADPMTKVSINNEPQLGMVCETQRVKLGRDSANSGRRARLQRVPPSLLQGMGTATENRQETTSKRQLVSIQQEPIQACFLVANFHQWPIFNGNFRILKCN